MLVLSRKRGQAITIGQVEVRVLEVRGETVRIGIAADQHTKIFRTELLSAERIKRENPATDEEEARWKDWAERQCQQGGGA